MTDPDRKLWEDKGEGAGGNSTLTWITRAGEDEARRVCP